MPLTMTLTINSPAVIAAARSFAKSHHNKWADLHSSAQLEFCNFALAALQAAGVGEMVDALERCRFDSLNMSLADLEFCSAVRAKFTGG